LSVSSTKAATGHALGASGALEAIATLCTLEQGVIPPTLNFLSSDPECDFDVTPNEPKRKPVGLALSNSFAFGGLNVSLAFTHPDA
jgi:nodulation protein E